jgi:DNA polymerase elongation subunit (family B)
MLAHHYFDGDGVSMYTRYRDSDNSLITKRYCPVRPYFYVCVDDLHEVDWESFNREWPHANVHDDELGADSVDGFKCIRISTASPYDIMGMKKYFPRTWDADVPFSDQWLIDNVDTMPDWNPRKCWFDIEWNPVDGNDFTQCWAAIDSYTGDRVCFAWRKNQDKYVVEQRDGYMLHIYCSESAVHEAVIQYIEEMDFDMLIAHAAMWADIPHMVRRFKNFKRLSPLGYVSKVRKGHDGYRFDDQPIKGRWVFDSAIRGSDGTGFERVWMDSGNGQFPSRKLGDIGEHLGLGTKDDVDLTNDWTDNFYRLTDYCVQDVQLMKDIDDYLSATDFFINMVRFCGVSFTSTYEVGKFARGLVYRRTGLVFPTRSKDRRRERGSVKGATVMDPTPGLHEGVAVLDFKGLYPSIILGDNLCWTTHRDEPTETTRTLSNGTHWEQKTRGILPEIIDYLFEERQVLKDSGNKILEKAVKRVMASLYGLVNETLGHGMADERIGATITAQGRASLEVLRGLCEDMGHPVLFGHTDSCFLLCSIDNLEYVAAMVTEIVQDATGNTKLIAEPEAWMPHWFCGDVKNRYAGIIAWPEDDAGKLKVSGFEMKHSSTPPFVRELQKNMLLMVAGAEDESDITSYIKSEVKRLRDGDVPIEDVSTSTRLSKNIRRTPDARHNADKHYPLTFGGFVKAAKYYNWNMSPDEPFKSGDSVKWTYVSGVPYGMPTTEVVGYRSVKELDGFVIATEGIIEKAVRKKLRLVYDVLGWDLKRAIDLHQPKTYW